MNNAMKTPWATALLTSLLVSGCTDLGGGDTDGETASPTSGGDTSGPGDGTDNPDDTTGTTNDESSDGDETGTGTPDLPSFDDAQDAAEVNYRDDLAAHVGCSVEGLAYTPASIDGYPCAAKDYTDQEDTSKPIVLLVHGNSDTPDSWETFDPAGSCKAPLGGEGGEQLAEVLAANGFRTVAADLRFDLVDEPDTNNDTENAARNMDHGWAVPIAQSFIRTMMEENPDRRFVVVGFSLGATVTRDALRRLIVNEGFNPYPQIDHAFILAGPNHGVSSFPLCGTNPTMRGTVTCEMGNRAAYSPTYFTIPLNGPEGAHETPCSDGVDAFGHDVCQGHTLEWTTIVMEDLDGGEQQDLFVSETSSALLGADNRTIGLNDFDTSNYFFCGLFRNHYGAVRSTAAHGIIGEKLGF